MPISLWAPLLAILIAPTPPAMDLRESDLRAASSGPAVVVAATAAPGWTAPVPGPVVRGFQPPIARWGRGHRGVDLAAPPGTTVRAAGSGVVVFAGTIAGRGVISIDHPAGVRTTYEPVRPRVSRGARVRGGQVIGVLVPDHRHHARLHWGARVRGDYIDPLRLLGRGAILKPVSVRRGGGPDR